MMSVCEFSHQNEGEKFLSKCSPSMSSARNRRWEPGQSLGKKNGEKKN